jgi:hypothetical protein
MGLLDDAIREHLDLKRRRGGDPVEIERAERDALGPVRRGPEDAEQPPTAPPAEDGHQYDYEAEPDWDDGYAEAPESGAPPVEEDHVPVEEDHAPAPVEEDHAEQLGYDESFGDPEEEPPPPSTSVREPPTHSVDEHTGQETAEYDVEGHLKRDHDEDVLEETPEFLQDTPEHDRLWFEQRPPRDFDFDG